MSNFASLPPGIDLSQVATVQPPPGVKQNFINPKSNAGSAIAVTVVFTVITFIFVCMRLYTKFFVSRSKGWDDYTCILSCLCAWAYMGVVVNVFVRGYTVHVWNFPISKLTKSLLETLNVASAFYGPTMFFTKLSLFILYYRLFSPSKIMRHLIYLGIAFNFIFYTVYLFIYALYCPNTSKKAPTCSHSVKVLGVATSAINVVSDFYVLLIPLCAISNLQLPPKRKLGLLAIFFTGFLACLCSIISLHYRVVLVRGNDNVWNVVPVLVISTVEFNIGIICSCLPTLPALFRRRPYGFQSKPSYLPNSASNSRGTQPRPGGTAGVANGGSKKGFGKLEAEGSRDSVVALEAGRATGEEGDAAYEMKAPVEMDERAREWFRQARM